MKRDPHFLTYIEMMNAPTPKQQASRALRRWVFFCAALTCIGLAFALASRAHSKALHDAEWACHVGAVCE